MDDVLAQTGYHRALYQALWDWPSAERAITRTGLHGVDMLGHFGAPGCDLIVESIVERAPRGPLRLAELGSGLGGVLRHLLPALDGRVPVAFAVGCELVEEHCRLAGVIGRGAAGPPAFMVCTSVARPGIRRDALDVVLASGAASHFSDMAATLREAHRVLRPGGLLTFTEEVSLTGPAGEPSAAFRALHPPDVFFTATWPQRRTQLEVAGFAGIEMRDLSDWAATLLHRRLLALRVQRRAVAEIYGEAATKRIADTLAAAREEITQGRLAPAHVVATAGPRES
jgi:SAM-dependent methyltransferase